MLRVRRQIFPSREVALALCLLFVVAILLLRPPTASCAVNDMHQVSSGSRAPTGVSSPSKVALEVVAPLKPRIGTLERPASKYAFVCYLAPTEDDKAGRESKDDDVYMTSARMLIYQTQHDPQTRTNTSIPFVVLVSPEVSQSKRRRLEREGAFVAEFPSIQLDTVKPGRSRWEHVMDKLNVFRLTQFEKVLLMDTDIVIFKRLDAIFEEPETNVQTNLGMRDQTKDDEGVQPQQYLLAADSGPIGHDNHPWPAERSKVLNAGFMVLHPSEEMLRHYIKIASIEGRTPMAAPENNLLEYVHRPSGNMPYSQIRNTWVMNHPIYNDYDKGIAAVHEKWWRNSMRDLKLKEVLLRVRWKMEGYWNR